MYNVTVTSTGLNVTLAGVGAQGMSAYDAAVLGGFVGTSAEFYAYLADFDGAASSVGASVTLAQAWATQPTGEVVVGEGFSAKKNATDAADSANTATTQVGLAAAQVVIAKDWATKAGSEVVAGQGFSAKKYAIDAQSYSATATQKALEASISQGQSNIDAATAINKALAASNSATSASNSATAAGNSALAAFNSETAAGVASGTAVTKANEAYSSAQTASTKAGEAAASQTAAGIAAGNAAISANAAGTSASNANTSFLNAEAEHLAAKDWATKLTTEVVVGQGYSAKQYALDAAAQVSIATTKAGQASDSAITAGLRVGDAADAAYAAAQSAIASANSAGQVGGVIATANAAVLKAEAWAEADSGVQVETGKYSAKHWANFAQSTVTGGLTYRGGHDMSTGVYPAIPALGDYYKITAGGTIGAEDYAINDSIIYNGTTWDKIDSSESVSSVAGKVGVVTLTSSDVGLGAVDNTRDADKPVSSAVTAALADKIGPNGVGATGTWPISVSGSAAATPWTGLTGKPSVIATGTTQAEARAAIGAGTGSSDLAIGTTALTAKAGDWTPLIGEVSGLSAALDAKVAVVSGKGLSPEEFTAGEKSKLAGIGSGATANLPDADLLSRSNHTGTQAINTITGLQDALANAGTVVSVSGKTGIVALEKADVGLANADNTSDLAKPISTATQAALNAKQSTLVSGTNIKTINGESMVGSGDLVIVTDKNLDGGTSSSIFSYADFQIDCGGSI